MYSNDTTQIRSGLVNYLGALISASKYDPQITKHNVSSILLEETLKLAKDENNIYDFYILKPLFRANIIVFQNKINAIKSDIETLPTNLREPLKEKQKKYEIFIQMMNELLEALDKNDFK